MVQAWIAAAALVAWGCASTWQGDGYDTTQLPEGLRADYALFAQRCSKCHSLSRPLSSGIDDDRFWKMYVEQMRLKPGSGISMADEEPILRFLHYYSFQKKGRDIKAETPAPSAGAPEPATRQDAK
jgi:hypothetical protein